MDLKAEDQKIKSCVGENLQRLLKEQRRTITELSEYTGLSRPTIYRILEKKSSLRLQDAIRIARFFDVSVERLYGLDVVDNIPRQARVTPVFGLYQDSNSPGLQKLYKNLARKELAQILAKAAELLEEEK